MRNGEQSTPLHCVLNLHVYAGRYSKQPVGAADCLQVHWDVTEVKGGLLVMPAAMRTVQRGTSCCHAAWQEPPTHGAACPHATWQERPIPGAPGSQVAGQWSRVPACFRVSLSECTKGMIDVLL